jgi:carbon storage regulator
MGAWRSMEEKPRARRRLTKPMDACIRVPKALAFHWLGNGLPSVLPVGNAHLEAFDQFSGQRRNVSVLVLSRKAGQRIQIGPDIAVTVVKLNSGGVRLGIEAPPELAVVRGELAEQMQVEAEAQIEALRIFQGEDAEN